MNKYEKAPDSDRTDSKDLRQNNKGLSSSLAVLEDAIKEADGEGDKLIFMSHSKKDKSGQNFFDELFSRHDTGYRPFWYSYEVPNPPHAETIFTVMSASFALFVVLSEHMMNRYTLAWVGYEVGLAKALKLPIYVFEKEDYNPVPIPIPGATAYFRRPTKIENRKDFPIDEITKSISVSKDELRFKNGPSGILFAICPYQDCKAEYHFYPLKKTKRFLCATCRREVKFSAIAKHDNLANLEPVSWFKSTL